MPDRDFHIITKMPSEYYFNSEVKNKEIGEENKPLSLYEDAIIVFDDILVAPNSN